MSNAAAAADAGAAGAEALDGLYLGGFDDFVRSRNDVAKQLRAQGNREAGDAVRALKKPSRVAWSLNHVALDEGVREDFQRHRLTTEHDAAGLGGLSPDTPQATRKGGQQTRSTKDAEREEAKRRRDVLKAAEKEARKLDAHQEEADREVQAARQTAERAQRDLERAVNELDQAASEAAAARERVDDLRV